MCRRSPILTLILTFVLSVASIAATPLLRELTIWWNCSPDFVPFVHLFEFAAGIVFCRCIRNSRKTYCAVAMLSFIGLSVYFVVVDSSFFAPSWSGMLAGVCLCVCLCFAFELLAYSDGVLGVIGFLSRSSFLAFLYHHVIINKILNDGTSQQVNAFVGDVLLVVFLSFVLAWLSEKPVVAVRKMVFGR